MLVVVPDPRDSALVRAELRSRPLLSYAVRTARELRPDVVVVADSHDAGLSYVLGPSVAVRSLDVPADVAQLQNDKAGEQVVVHDPRCPLLSVADLRRVAASGAAAAVGVRPVTDTVKTVRRGDIDLVAATLDREALRAVCSPLALSPAAVSTLSAEVGPGWWTVDLWVLVAALRSQLDVDLVEVSSLGRRVEDADALLLLECFDDARELAS